MQHIVTILIAILIFCIIVVIHEFGHFIAAKLNRIQVNQFAVGMGPKLLHFQKGKTEYSLRLFPVGGFCAMEGEDQSSDNPNAFEKKPVWRRMTVILAGPFMNLVLGFLLIVILLCTAQKVPSLTIARFAETTNAAGETVTAAESERSGLQVGDKIVAIDGSHIFSTSDLIYKLQTTDTETYDITVKRDGKRVTIENVTFHNDNTDGLLDFAVEGKPKNPVTIVSYAAKDTVATAKLIWMSLVELVSGKYGLQDLSGPVGTVSVIEQFPGTVSVRHKSDDLHYRKCRRVQSAPHPRSGRQPFCVPADRGNSPQAHCQRTGGTGAFHRHGSFVPADDPGNHTRCGTLFSKIGSDIYEKFETCKGRKLHTGRQSYLYPVHAEHPFR